MITCTCTYRRLCCHLQPCNNHRISCFFLDTVALLQEPKHGIMRQDLTKSLNLRIEIKVLGYLLDALPSYCSLDEIFCSHRGRPGSYASGCHILVVKICGDLRSRCENLPDFKASFQLNYFNSFHRVSNIFLRCIFSHHCGLNFVRGLISRDHVAHHFVIITIVQGYHIAASTANFAGCTIENRLLISCELGCSEWH